MNNIEYYNTMLGSPCGDKDFGKLLYAFTYELHYRLREGKEEVRRVTRASDSKHGNRREEKKKCEDNPKKCRYAGRRKEKGENSSE